MVCQVWMVKQENQALELEIREHQVFLGLLELKEKEEMWDEMVPKEMMEEMALMEHPVDMERKEFLE